MKRIRSHITSFAIVSSLALLGATGCQHEAHHESKPREFRVTTPLTSDTALTRDYVCQIHAIRHIELRALERGYLQDVFVDEGRHVTLGQPMFQIMPMLYEAELDMARANTSFARIEYDNTRLLADRDVVSDNELALARAELQKAEAELALSTLHRELTGIKAPFAGIMDRLEVRPGSLVEEGELLTTLSDNSEMWVYFNVTEAEYLDHQERVGHDGAEVVQLVMANGKRFPHAGTVSAIEADFDNETGTIAFRATFPNPEGLLRHGQTGKVLMTTAVPDALLIPQKATFEVLDRKYVFVIDDENVVRAREIEIAHELPHLYVIGSGLDADERFLFEGLRQVKDGDQIMVEQLAPAALIAELEVPAE
ncbi:MAG: hemolysin D [Planctomycetota bacterium]|nr:MAG: hemolysin D [Planctomycetota bacterium]